MPVIKTKASKAKTKAKKPTRKPIKAKATALVKSQPKSHPKSLKNPVAYFQCMSVCCQKGIKPKKITEIARECKHNALAINTKMSAQKTQAVKKIKQGYETLGKGLGELLKASQ